MINASQIRARMSTLSEKIDDYYEEALRRINERQEKAVLTKLLNWTFYATQPLHIKELEIALSVDDDNTDDIDVTQLGVTGIQSFIAATEGLVVTRPVRRKWDDADRGEAVILAHETIAAFLRKNTHHLHSKAEMLLFDVSVKFLSAEKFIRFVPWLSNRSSYRIDLFFQKMEDDERARKGLGIDKDTLDQIRPPMLPEYPGMWSKLWLDHPFMVFLDWALSCGDYITQMSHYKTPATFYADARYDAFRNLLRRLHELFVDMVLTNIDHYAYATGPLAWCAGRGWTVVCGWLMDERMIPARRSKIADDFLINAVMGHHTSIVSILAKSLWENPDTYGAGDPEPYRRRISRAFQCASEQAQIDTIDSLLQILKSDVNQEFDHGGLKAPILAGVCHFGEHWRNEERHQKGIKHLIASEYVDVNLGASDGLRPIHYTATHSLNGVTVAALLDRRDIEVAAELHLSNGHTWSALTIAIVHGNLASTRLLADQLQPDINSLDSRALTLPMLAATSPGLGEINVGMAFSGIEDGRVKDTDMADILSYLLARPGADVNIQDSFGRTVLSWAASGGLFFSEQTEENTMHCFYQSWPRNVHIEIVG